MRAKKLNNQKLNFKNGKSGQKGFTLIEMLVVVVIIGILAGVVFIALEGQGKRTRLAASVTSIKNAMTVATTCFSLGGTVQDPGTSVQEPLLESQPMLICEDLSQFANAFWPKLPERCLYCGIADNRISFQCTSADSCDSVSDKSFCDFKSGQCTQSN